MCGYIYRVVNCVVAKIVSVAGSPGDESIYTAVSVPTNKPLIRNSQSLHLILTPEHCLQSLGS